MLPVVEVAEPGPGEAELDRRNTRRVSWKEGRLALAHEALQPFLTPDQIPDPQAPVRACFRYISNHSQFLDYQGGPSTDLPIGWGEIESAHPYVFQKRLKVAGG